MQHKHEYVVKAGGFQEKFQNSRAKVQFIGGAFANGKTTSVIVKALLLARDYPGSRGLLGRATKVKLRTTLQREFFKWCPPSWIKKFNKSDQEIELVNGTVIDLRHINQKGTDDGESTSNLLSATYDWIAIDQIEDPEIQQKDFEDLMGRLRGDTPYAGTDKTMPLDGPRWFMLTANPTGNWVYYKLAKPVQDFRLGIDNPDLIRNQDTGEPMIEMFEGSTYDNMHNLKRDFVQGLEATYRGQMRDRYLLGKWASYDGLVYPMIEEEIHFVDHERVLNYVRKMRESHYTMRWVEGYDHGLAKPSCYILGLCDDLGNIICVDGFYKAEQPIDTSQMLIKTIRSLYGLDDEDQTILADPQLFRRGGTSDAKIVGKTVAELYADYGIRMARGNNAIANGIVKVQGYLHKNETHVNPFTSMKNAPMMYFSRKLDFVKKEIYSYHWQRQRSSGEIIDVPNDKNDHAMDVIKYITGSRPEPSVLVTSKMNIVPPQFIWYATESKSNADRDLRSSRHG